jgi:hypothetical protein
MLMECDMCGHDENVGFAGCEHEECKTIKVCDFCDVDGSNYNGWCIDEQEPVNPILLTRREAETLYAVLNVWCKCRERVLDAHNLHAFGYEDIDNVINKVANELDPAMTEWVETGILHGWIDVDWGIHFLSPALEPKFRVTD